ncbi:hypothetical protein KC19_5G076200 [Ceratodon purpureus]|uniref:Uncharacterized protein n=1 Tax=Ceratodon purpureus TaxID=3225 RepID=A0A8T0I027_CERPU|nr:hypothetical protein KC19_5G076200 [Ceratodon purpureus]
MFFAPRARETTRFAIRSCCRWILNLLTALRPAQEIRPRSRFRFQLQPVKKLISDNECAILFCQADSCSSPTLPHAVAPTIEF